MAYFLNGPKAPKCLSLQAIPRRSRRNDQRIPTFDRVLIDTRAFMVLWPEIAVS